MPAALFAKLLGMLYKIPLLYVVGVEGMAYFLAAYHVYALLFVVSSTGLPTALSLQVARARARGQGDAVLRTLRVAMTLFLLLGTALALSLAAFAEPIASALAISGAATSLRAIAPALCAAALIGAAKGYFQGHGRMGTTAIAEVLEAAGKLGFGIVFARMAVRRGESPERIAAAAIFGITAGLALSAAFLLVALLWHRARSVRALSSARYLPPYGGILAELLRVALPVTLGASVMSLASVVDTALISARLQSAGFAPDVAHAMYSTYGNLAIPFYNLLPSLLSPVTLALAPQLAAATQRGDAPAARGVLSSSMRIVTMLAVPAALGLSLFAAPLLSLLFATQDAAVALAAPLLSVLAFAVLPACLTTLMSAALQAIGRERVPVTATLVGVLCKLVIEFFLLGTPGVYLMGAPVSTIGCTLAVLLVEWRALCRALPFAPIRPCELFRPLAATIPALGAGLGVYTLLLSRLDSAVVTLLALCAVLVLYVPLSLRLGVLEREDLLSLPAGERILPLLEKWNLLKGSGKHDKTGKAGIHPAKGEL